MKQSHKTLLVILVAVAVAIGGLVYLANRPTAPGQYDKLAQCLTQKGVKFYGAWWCPHCAEEKRILGSSLKEINYIECGLPDNQQGQTQVCQDAKIESYPTWEFADGSRLTGVQQPQDLASKAGCSVQ